MEQYEKVERISQQTGASFEEAKHALEACGWDMLDAAILLEKRNAGAKKQKVFSTDYEAQPGFKNVAASNDIANGQTKAGRNSGDFGEKVKDFFRKSHENHFVLRHNGNVIVSLPIWAMVLIALCLFKLTVILLIISLVCGCRLTFEGPEGKKMDSVNKVVNTAGQAMSGAAAVFKSSFEANYSKKNNTVAPASGAAYNGSVQETVQKEAPQQEAPQQEETAQQEAPMQTAEEFEKEDFSAIAEGFAANSVTTEDGKITLEL